MRKRGEADAFLRSLVSADEAGCVLWPYNLSSSGYGYVYLGKRYITANRRMCLLAHGEPANPKMEAAHSCGVRKCVNPNHLSWKTKLQNAADRLIHGTDTRGSRSPCAKLSWDDVRQIRASTEIAEKIAPKFGISSKQVRRIRAGKQWSEPRIAA